MKESFTGTPPMPPFLLRSSAIISAAAFAGTPNTEAGPDKKVVIPILISCGLFCAWAAPAKFATIRPAATAALRNCIDSTPWFSVSRLASVAVRFFLQQRYYNSHMLPALYVGVGKRCSSVYTGMNIITLLRRVQKVATA